MPDPPARFERQFDAGEALFCEGDPADQLFVIRSGQVRVSRRMGRRRRTIADMGRGDFVGELAMIASRPHAARAVATEPTSCWALDAAALEAMLSQDGEIAVRFVQTLAARLDAANRWLELLTQREGRARVVLALAWRVEQSPRPGERDIQTGLDEDELGRLAAAEPTEVAGAIDHLARIQVVRVATDGIWVTDPARLRELAQAVGA